MTERKDLSEPVSQGVPGKQHPLPDYSDRPQRPIALKEDIGSLNIPTPPRKKARPVQKEAIPQPKIKKKTVKAVQKKAPTLAKTVQKKAPTGARTVQKKAPAGVRTVQKKASTGSQWTLRDVSPEAREIATQAAEKEGVKLSVWLENAIYRAAEPAVEEGGAPDVQLEPKLNEIVERLERIETQRGLVAQFWDWLTDLKNT